jgi:hypothetical protein
MSFYRRKSRKRWSINANRKIARNRIEQAKAAFDSVVREYEELLDKNTKGGSIK